MNKEMAKDVLAGYFFDFKYFNEKIAEIERLKQKMVNMSEKMSVLLNNNKELSQRENYKKIMIKQLEEEKFLLKSLEQKHKIERIIDNIPQPYKTVLYLRYIVMYNFDEIAQKLNYSDKRIYQLHSEAIEQFAKAFNNKNKIKAK